MGEASLARSLLPSAAAAATMVSPVLVKSVNPLRYSPMGEMFNARERRECLNN